MDDADPVNNDDADEFLIQLQDSPSSITYISQLGNTGEIGLAYDGQRHIGSYEEAFKSSSLSLKERESSSGIPTSAFAVPQATLDVWEYDRPLPRLPKAKPSFDHFRKSSTSSNAPSITPSLLPWCDRDSNSLSPEPVIGVAAVVPVLRSSPPDDSALQDNSFCSSAGCSIETPSQPLQAPRLASNPLVSIPEAIFSQQSVTIRKSGRKNSLSIIAQGRLIIQDSDDEGNDPEDHFGSTSPAPSEAEWLSREQTLSPVKRDLGWIDISTRYGLDRAEMRNKTDSLEDLRKKRMAWGGNRSLNQPADDSEDEDQGSLHPLTGIGSIVPRVDDKDPYRMRNWI